jgi:hypothetical protein
MFASWNRHRAAPAGIAAGTDAGPGSSHSRPAASCRSSGRSTWSITGTGAVTVNGGSGGDLFVGGTTSYDTTATGHLDLMIILAEWRSAIDPYTTRTDEITDGTIPGHSGIKLATGVGGTVTLNSSAVAEHLNGHPSLTDLDWFFASTASQHSALETVGGVTELVNDDPA